MSTLRRYQLDRSHVARRGLTLFEIMLVLGLLVAVGAVAFPAIEGSFRTARLRNAADRIRTVWSDARLEAMRTGIIHEFRFEDGGQRYMVRAWSADGATPTTSGGPTGSDTPEAVLGEHTLPDDLSFIVGISNLDQRASFSALAAGANTAVEGTYSAPILFYPDGTATDAVLHLKNESYLYIRVALRGLTAISRTSAVLTADEMRQ